MQTLELARPVPSPVSLFDRLRPQSIAERVQLRHLRSQAQIEQVLPLRDEIDLSVHGTAGDEFLRLEKKETNSASSAPSSSTVN